MVDLQQLMGDQLLARASQLARQISTHRELLIEVLTSIATRDSALGEIEASIRALHGLRAEQRYLMKLTPGVRIAVYLPSNNILYSFVLYVLIPQLWGATVVARPSSRVKSAYLSLVDILREIASNDVNMVDVTQRSFLETAAECELVVFTGHPENGRQIASLLPKTVRFLGFGSGPNPVIIGSHADLSRAVHDSVMSRMYNSGQDCLCPDVFLVHETVAPEFTNRLTSVLSEVRVAERHDPGMNNVPLTYADAALELTNHIDANRQHIVWQGDQTADAKLVPITLLLSELNFDSSCPEMFGPVFNVLTYKSANEIDLWLARVDNLERGFYVSVYGEPALQRRLVLRNAVNCGPYSALQSENGNKAFGGYGHLASWVSVNGEIAARPLLLSREAALQCAGITVD